MAKKKTYHIQYRDGHPVLGRHVETVVTLTEAQLREKMRELVDQEVSFEVLERVVSYKSVLKYTKGE